MLKAVPPLVVIYLEDMWVLLSVVEMDDELGGCDLLERTLVEYATPHVWSLVLVVGVEIDHVSPSKVRQEIILLFGDKEREGVVASRAIRFFVNDAQTGKDIACLPLHAQWHVP